VRIVSSGIDTMVLIYAGVVPTNPGVQIDADLRLRAKLLLHMLTNAGATIILPAAKHGEFLAALQSHFVCAPFDVKASSIAADLFAEHAKLDRTAKYTSRQVLKADVLIIAAAKSAGATDFYSHEKQCRTLASKVMQAHDLPTHDPNDMFLMDDIKRGEVEGI
jgi:hypothetical protein